MGMCFQSHFQLMANYNDRMNLQIVNVVGSIANSHLNENKGGFFESIFGTLNHILVADLIWLSRFNLHSNNYKSLQTVSELPTPKNLSDILYSDFESYMYVRKTVDSAIKNWLDNDIDDSDFNRSLEYSNTTGIKTSRNFGELLSHFFNHQTHHRGQISTLLNQIGHDIGVTDFLFDIPEASA